MIDSFEIPLTYKSRELLFPATLAATGYTYKIHVDVFGTIISFEPDEERNFRAVLSNEDIQLAGKIDKELLKEIAAAIEAIVK